nr:hypothetical protein [Alphaproteobacteria bacterium]
DILGLQHMELAYSGGYRLTVGIEEASSLDFDEQWVATDDTNDDGLDEYHFGDYVLDIVYAS